MASYEELYGLQNNDPLLEKVAVAAIVAADAIRTEGAVTNHPNRMIWAEKAFADPRGIARQVLWAVLAANKDNTVAQIQSATDAQIQAAVDAAVNVLAGE